MQIKPGRDGFEIELKHKTYRGTTRDLWMGVRQTELGPLVNLAASGDLPPAAARRLAHALLVAADMADELAEE